MRVGQQAKAGGKQVAGSRALGEAEEAHGEARASHLAAAAACCYTDSRQPTRSQPVGPLTDETRRTSPACSAPPRRTHLGLVVQSTGRYFLMAAISPVSATSLLIWHSASSWLAACRQGKTQTQAGRRGWGSAPCGRQAHSSRTPAAGGAQAAKAGWRRPSPGGATFAQTAHRRSPGAVRVPWRPQPAPPGSSPLAPPGTCQPPPSAATAGGPWAPPPGWQCWTPACETARLESCHHTAKRCASLCVLAGRLGSCHKMHEVKPKRLMMTMH